MFRALTAQEVQCRIKTTTKNGEKAMLLFYKDARADMNILDESVGPMNWKKQYTNGNMNCIVSIYDDKKKEWVSKEDCGSAGNDDIEKDKSLASDSFKRACVVWGIGRELYTAPSCWVPLNEKGNTYENFSCSELEVVDGKITYVAVVSDKTRKQVFSWGKKQKTSVKNEPKPEEKKEDTGEHILNVGKDNKYTGKKVKDVYYGCGAEGADFLHKLAESIGVNNMCTREGTFAKEFLASVS